VLCGAEDQRVRPDDCRRILQALAGEKHLEMFEGVGHASLLKAHPERWATVVGAFLESVAREARPQEPAAGA
jgi:alpha-beta hydrolase superfamily lysophospholipase